MDSGYDDSFVVSVAAAIENNSQFERTRFLRQHFDSVMYSNPRVFDFGSLIAYEDEAFSDKSILLGTREQYLNAYKWVQPTFAQNLGAMRALATNGIQAGHMKLHVRNMAVTAGAIADEIDNEKKSLLISQELKDTNENHLIYTEPK